MAAWPYNTAQWKNLRAIKLHASPMCEPCKQVGRSTIANTVDHQTAISAGGHPFPGIDRLTSMCQPCHSAKTARGPEAGAVRTTRALQPRKGCDANGTPLDPAHPWHATKLLTAVTEQTGLAFFSQLVIKLRADDENEPHG